MYATGYPVTSIPADKLDYIAYAFAVPYQDGTIRVDDNYAASVNFPQLRALKANHPRLKTLISIGGANSSASFPVIARSPVLRAKFAQDIADFMKENGFDGVDIDWEHPNATQRDDFTNLLTDVRKTIGPDKIQAIAVPANPNLLNNMDFVAISKQLDIINVMAYDYNGTWSKLTDYNAPLHKAPDLPPVQSPLNVGDTMMYCVTKGAPKSQLYQGVPFYGRGFAGVTSPGQDQNGLYQKYTGALGQGPVNYTDIKAKYANNPNYKRHYNTATASASLYSQTDGAFIGYDDIDSMKQKTAYGKAQGFAGVMIWDLGKDKSGELLDGIHSSIA